MNSPNQLHNAPMAGYATVPYGVQGLQQPLHQPPMQHQHAGFGPGQAYTPMMMQNYAGAVNYQQPAFQPPNGFAAVHAQNAVAPASSAMAVPIMGNSGIGGLTEAELEARFAQLEADFEFANEMDTWMAEYGPTLAERGETANTAGQEENVDEILEKLAEELEAQKLDQAGTTGVERTDGHQTGAQAVMPEPLVEQQAAFLEEQQMPLHTEKLQELPVEALEQETEHEPTKDELGQDDLVRTAEQIVNTLDAHPSERFRESAFVGLMRRIQAREVTVQGDVLLDSTTGKPVESAGQTAEHSETGGGVSLPSAGPQQEVA